MDEDARIPSALLDLHGGFYRSFVAGNNAPSSPTTSPLNSWQWCGESLIGIGFIQKHGPEADSHAMDPNHYSAIYVLSGQGTFSDDTGYTAELRPGSIFQRIPGRKHTAIFDPSIRYVEIFLAFSLWLLEPLSRIMLLTQRPVVYLGIDLALIRDLAAAHEALQRVRETDLPRVYLHHLGMLASMFSGAQSRSAQLRGPSMLLAPGSAPGSVSDQPLDWIDEACRLLAEEATGRATLERIAKRLDLGYEVFRKEFRERMGISPGDYRIRRRLDRARELLLSTKTTVTDIADELGYPNASVFSLQFKRLIGSSPEHYRRRSG